MKNSIRILVAALAIGGTIAGTTAFALKDQPVYINPSYANENVETSNENVETYSRSFRVLGHKWTFSSKKLVIDDENGADFLLTWTADYSQFTIDIGGNKLGAGSRQTDLNTNAHNWYVDGANIIRRVDDSGRALAYQKTGSCIKYYANTNLDASDYVKLSFTDFSWGEWQQDNCAAIIGQFAVNCLNPFNGWGKTSI